MEKRRWNGRSGWREWLLSALLGVGLALALLFCLGVLHGPRVPAGELPSTPREEAEQSLGFEFTVRFRILFPKAGDGPG